MHVCCVIFNKVSVSMLQLLYPSRSLYRFLQVSSCFLRRRTFRYFTLTDTSGGFRHVQHVRPNRGPHKKSGAVNFCMPKNGLSPSETSVMRKKGRQFFPGKIGSAAPVKGPHIFSEQGPSESKSGPDRHGTPSRNHHHHHHHHHHRSLKPH